MAVTYGAFVEDKLACRALELLAAEGIPTVILTAGISPQPDLVAVFTCDGPYHNGCLYSRFLTDEDCAPGSRYQIPKGIASLSTKLALRPWSIDTTDVFARRLAGFRASLLNAHARLTHTNLLRVQRPRSSNTRNWRCRSRDERPLAL